MTPHDLAVFGTGLLIGILSLVFYSERCRRACCVEADSKDRWKRGLEPDEPAAPIVVKIRGTSDLLEKFYSFGCLCESCLNFGKNRESVRAIIEYQGQFIDQTFDELHDAALWIDFLRKPKSRCEAHDLPRCHDHPGECFEPGCCERDPRISTGTC